MINRLYIHNFRCLENFELPISGHSSVLLIGKNGAGKTTVGAALQILQKIARGVNRIGDLVKPKDFAHGRESVPMRFEIEVKISLKSYKYAIAFEYPEGFRELRVFDEKLTVDGRPIFEREKAQVRLARNAPDAEARFSIDWHLVALPIIQRSAPNDPLIVFKQWLADVLILRPIPSLIKGDSEQDTLQPDEQVKNFGSWFSGILATAPASYAKIDSYLKEVMPDLRDVMNPVVGKDAHSLVVRFSKQDQEQTLSFEDLSDGEKCFMIFALVMAANYAKHVLCFWDEPDNYLAPFEVGPSIMALRKSFSLNGQLIVTSHNPEAIRHFSDENTLVLYRNSHLEPTIAQTVEELRARGNLKGNFIDTLVRGDLEV